MNKCDRRHSAFRVKSRFIVDECHRFNVSETTDSIVCCVAANDDYTIDDDDDDASLRFIAATRRPDAKNANKHFWHRTSRPSDTRTMKFHVSRLGELASTGAQRVSKTEKSIFSPLATFCPNTEKCWWHRRQTRPHCDRAEDISLSHSAPPARSPSKRKYFNR